jgi:hypothetical protein
MWDKIEGYLSDFWDLVRVQGAIFALFCGILLYIGVVDSIIMWLPLPQIVEEFLLYDFAHWLLFGGVLFYLYKNEKC